MGSDANAASRQELAAKIRNDHLHGGNKRKIAPKLFIVGGAIAVVVGALWLQISFRDHQNLNEANPRHATEEFGFLSTGPGATGDSPVPVVITEDFLCSSCALFHSEASDFLNEQLSAGSITVEYRPISFLAAASPNEYSQRAANAAACVADEAGVQGFLAMHDTLFEHQPKHGAAGPSDAELTEFASAAGAPEAASCIEQRRFAAWDARGLEAAVASGVRETPYVQVGGSAVVRSVNGKLVMPGVEELRYAIDAERGTK